LTPIIKQLSSDDFQHHLAGLADLLVDAVDGGHSLGFVAPFSTAEAREWWLSRYDALVAGALRVWVADGPGGVVGTVSLVLDGKANDRHRGDIVKLMVHREARGQGLGRELLATAESAAANVGLTLLMLDTETDSVAEALYDKAGWTRYGMVPDYAADPAGVLQPCTFFYKRI
jgi:ribosomal protein S18 acetylase RimI-like enzyme